MAAAATAMHKDDAPTANADVYLQMRDLQSKLEFANITESYLKDEMKNLKRELIRAKSEVKRIQSVPLVIGQFNELVDQNYGIISSTSGNTYYVRILSTLDREELKPNSSIALHRHSHAVVDILPPEADSSIQMMQMTEKPDVTYKDIGGMDIQKQEVREAVELPLTHFELYKQIGIDPPRGVSCACAHRATGHPVQISLRPPPPRAPPRRPRGRPSFLPSFLNLCN